MNETISHQPGSKRTPFFKKSFSAMEDFNSLNYSFLSFFRIDRTTYSQGGTSAIGPICYPFIKHIFNRANLYIATARSVGSQSLLGSTSRQPGERPAFVRAREAMGNQHPVMKSSVSLLPSPSIESNKANERKYITEKSNKRGSSH